MISSEKVDPARKKQRIEARRKAQALARLERLDNMQLNGTNIPEPTTECSGRMIAEQLQSSIRCPGDLLFPDTRSRTGEGDDGSDSFTFSEFQDSLVRLWHGKSRVGDERQGARRSAVCSGHATKMCQDKSDFLLGIDDRTLTNLCEEAWDKAYDKHSRDFRYTKHHYCCRVCLKPGPTEGSDDVKPLLKCSKCKSVFYCSVECQKKDYKNHKAWCYDRGTVLNVEMTPKNKIPWFRSNLNFCTSCGCKVSAGRDLRASKNLTHKKYQVNAPLLSRDT